MGDAMSSMEPQCEGCKHWSGSYMVKPCLECSKAFSGMQKDYYEEEVQMGFIPEEKVTDSVKELAEAHWSYVEAMLTAHGENPEYIERIGFHYVSAFIHGHKHAVEEMENIND